MLSVFSNPACLASPLILFLIALVVVSVHAGSSLVRGKFCSLLFIAGGAIFCFLLAYLITPTTYVASDLRLVPDSVEYAVGAAQFVAQGEFNLNLGQATLPSRYLPWMSLWVLGPSYLLYPDELGSGAISMGLHLAIILFSLFLIGIRIAKARLGGALLIAPFCVPGFLSAAQQILTEIPTVAALSVTMLAFIEVSLGKRGNVVLLICAGIAIAWGAAIRPLASAAALPFVVLLVRERRLGSMGALLTPLAIVALLSISYTKETFGTPFRGGYQFWLSFPYDQLSEVFSLRFLASNIKVLFLESWGSFVTLLAVFGLLQKKPREVQAEPSAASAVEFTWYGVTPLLLAHLVYFFSSSRLFIVAGVFMVIAALIPLFQRLPKMHETRMLVAGGGTILCVAAIFQMYVWAGVAPRRRIVMEAARAALPANAVFVTGVDPLYATWWLKPIQPALVLPISRRVEYASKTVTPTVPSGSDGAQSLKNNSYQAISQVATENPEVISSYLASGVPVYLDSVFTTEREREFLSERFALSENSPHIIRIGLH